MEEWEKWAAHGGGVNGIRSELTGESEGGLENERERLRVGIRERMYTICTMLSN